MLLTFYRISTDDQNDSSSMVDPTRDYTRPSYFAHIDDDYNEIHHVPTLDPFSATVDDASYVRGAKSHDSSWRILLGDLRDVFTFFVLVALGMLALISIMYAIADSPRMHPATLEASQPLWRSVSAVNTGQ